MCVCACVPLCICRVHAYESAASPYEHMKKYPPVFSWIFHLFMIMCVRVRIQGFLLARCVITGRMSRSRGREITIEQQRHQVELTRPVLPAMQRVHHHAASAGKPPSVTRQQLQEAKWHSIISLTDIYLPYLHALRLSVDSVKCQQQGITRCSECTVTMICVDLCFILDTLFLVFNSFHWGIFFKKQQFKCMNWNLTAKLKNVWAANGHFID